MRIIKKYENRKLYDMELSKYTTLTKITDLIKRGYDIQVLDSKDADITRKVLGQCISYNADQFSINELTEFLS